ncbi:hypothetical protein [Sphingobium sp. D43FB]|uniref:hypothetical protein n=1 Tax=Sphingobium sp. D43FB TaxID=2017595 RepID=UPI001143128F|nr:hypothetical protein [Sphingobium sp. D43FB]
MTLAASVAMGLGLGSYVTSPQKTAVPAEVWSPDDDNSYAEAGRAASMFGDSGTGDRGPAVIRCTGCGPTLTERRFAADMAGMDSDGLIEGSSDPLVQDYLAQDYPVTDGSRMHDAASEKPVGHPRLDRSKVAVADPVVKPVPISPGAVVQPIIVPTIDHNHP